MEELVQALQDNKPMEEVLRKRILNAQEANMLLAEENKILLHRLNLSTTVITATGGKQATLNDSRKRKAATLCAGLKTTIAQSGFNLIAVSDGELFLDVFEFLEPEFSGKRFKMKKNDLKFLGNDLLMFRFNKSAISKLMKTKIKVALDGSKVVYWNTAFVDVSAELITVIQGYKDGEGRNIYANIAKKLSSLIVTKLDNSAMTTSTAIRIPNASSESQVTIADKASAPEEKRNEGKCSYNVLQGIFSGLIIVPVPTEKNNMVALLNEMSQVKLRHISPLPKTGQGLDFMAATLNDRFKNTGVYEHGNEDTAKAHFEWS